MDAGGAKAFRFFIIVGKNRPFFLLWLFIFVRKDSNDMELKNIRISKNEDYTVGRFYVNDSLFCDSLEDKDRGLVSSMSLAQINKIKVYGQTAIPTGRYEVRMTHSPKFASRSWAKPTKGLVPELIDVPGFSGVRIHPFNTAEESLGCIGLGTNDKKGWISGSTRYYRLLVDKYIVPALKSGEKVYMVIK